MRKHIKVLVGMIAVISLVICMAVPSFAADEGTLAITNDPTEVEDGVYTLETDEGTITWADLDNTSAQDKNGVWQIGLKPVSTDFVEDAFVEFTFEVDTAGDYVLTVSFAGDNSNRKANFTVDGKNSTALNVEDGYSWDVQTQDLTVKLSAGEHKVRFTNDPAFDGSTVKAVNVVSVSWKVAADAPETGAPGTGEPAETDAAETDAPETEAPETDAPETNAPETDAPTTQAPTTQAPTTQAPTTQAPATQAPTTDAAKDEGGCGSALGMSAALTVVISVLGVAIVGKKH